MVYNAMKLFMEVNPQLFDECTHDYTENQNNAEERAQARQAKWDKLAAQAKAVQNGHAPVQPVTSTNGSKAGTPMRNDDADPLSNDSSRRLEALRLQDDAGGRERRPKEYNSVR
jgi:serine/threonine-protein phosphatase 2A regulatory subunit B'